MKNWLSKLLAGITPKDAMLSERLFDLETI